MTPVEYLKMKTTARKIKDFGLPIWLSVNCVSCKRRLTQEEIISIELDFEPSCLGDISIVYLCPKCSTSFIYNLQADVKNWKDVLGCMTSLEIPCNFINRDEIRKSGHHNLLDETKISFIRGSRGIEVVEND